MVVLAKGIETIHGLLLLLHLLRLLHELLLRLLLPLLRKLHLRHQHWLLWVRIKSTLWAPEGLSVNATRSNQKLDDVAPLGESCAVFQKGSLWSTKVSARQERALFKKRIVS